MFTYQGLYPVPVKISFGSVLEVEDLGGAAHSVASAHGAGPDPAQPVKLPLLAVVQPVITPGVEEHLAVAVEGQVQLDVCAPLQDKVSHSGCLWL